MRIDESGSIRQQDIATEDRRKFPQGLRHLADTVHGLGMKFGLWVEPEMVNPNSDLYRKHPDWAMHFTDRPRSEARWSSERRPTSVLSMK